MRKILFVVSCLCLLIGLLPVSMVGADIPPELPQVVIYQGDVGDIEYSGTISHAGGNYGQTFTVDFPVKLYSISVYLKRYTGTPDYGSREVAISLYECTYESGPGHWHATGPVLAYKLFDSFDLPKGETDENGHEGHGKFYWVGAYTVNESVVLQPGHNYSITVYPLDSGGIVSWQDASPTGGHAVGTNVYSGGVELNSEVAVTTNDMCFFVSGWWVEEGQVVTLPAEYKKDNSLVMRGMVKAMGYDDYCQVYIDYGWSSALGNSRPCGEVRLVGTGMIPGAGASNQFKIMGNIVFEATVTSLQPGMTIYYQARMVGESTNDTAVGEVLSFVVPGRNVGLELKVLENTVQEVDFEVWIGDLGNYTSVGLNITYGLNYTTCYNHNVTLLITSNATSPGSYNYTSLRDDDFDYGVAYTCMAEMIYGGQIVARSDPVTFRRYDPNAPGWLNWLWNVPGVWDIFGSSGSAIWWVFAFIGLLIIWGFALLGKKKRVWLGVLGTFIMLGIFIVTGLVDLWLVVLLAIVAGLIIYKLVFRKAGPGGIGD